MAFHSMFDYTAARNVQDRSIEIYGAPCTVFKPKDGKPLVMQGYENLSEMDQFSSKVFVDFHPKRRVFYHFNWFPEGDTQVTMGFFTLSTPVAADWFIRTKTMEQVSPYGDILFRVVYVVDDGKYKALKRTVFMTAISDRTMYEFMKVKA